MITRFPSLTIDPLSFIIGFVAATIFWWLLGRIRPLLKEFRQNRLAVREESIEHTSASVDEHHRQNTLKLAQGMHLAASLFSLQEILFTPRLLAPPPVIEPGAPLAIEDLVSQTLPYMPAWPEIGAIYNAATLSIQQALTGGLNLAIVGQPGSGKTVALAYLASLAANRDPSLGDLLEHVPVLVHFADLKLPVNDEKDVLNPLIDIISEHAPMLDLGRIPNFLKSVFRSGRALLLLDGLDELSPDENTKAVEYLDLLLKTYPKIRVVTTGCPEDIDGLVKLNFAPMTLMAWNARARREFLQNWGERWENFVSVEAWAQNGPEQVDPILLNTWLETECFAFTPLELTLAAWGAYAGDTRGPGPLDAIETHIRRISPKNVPVAALEMLAMQVSLSSQPLFDSQAAREWVKSFEPPDELPIEETEEDAEGEKQRKKDKIKAPAPGLLPKMADSGLLTSHPRNRMRFAHSVFGGYLAGRALSGYQATEALLSEPLWTGKVLALRYLAAHGNATPLAEKLLETSASPLQRGLLTVGRWLRDAPRQAPWRGKVMVSLAALLQEDGLPLGLRGQAMAAFALSRDPSVAVLFRQFLTSPSSDVTRLAAFGSGVIQDTKSIEHLEALFNLSDTFARRTACLALAAIGTTQALEIVATSLLRGDEDLRRAAAEALSNHPGEGYSMLKEGAGMEDLLVRRAVVYGLARLDYPWAVELLRKLQLEDDQWAVRNAATDMLDSQQIIAPRVPHRLPPASESAWLIGVAGKHGVGVTPGSPATEALLVALKSGEIEDQLAALPYLQRTPSKGVVGGLYHAMYGGDRELREAAFHSLWQISVGGVALPHPQEFGLG